MTILREFLIAFFAGVTCAVVLAAWLGRPLRRLDAKLDAIAALVALIRGNAGKSGEQKAKGDSFGATGWPGART